MGEVLVVNSKTRAVKIILPLWFFMRLGSGLSVDVIRFSSFQRLSLRAVGVELACVGHSHCQDACFLFLGVGSSLNGFTVGCNSSGLYGKVAICGIPCYWGDWCQQVD